MKFGPIVGLVLRNENTKFEQVLTIRVDGGIFQSWRNSQKLLEIDLNKY
jgi:hypothetical protein